MAATLNTKQPTIVTLATTLVQLCGMEAAVLDAAGIPLPPATLWLLPTVDCYLTIDPAKADTDARGTKEILLKANAWFPYEPEGPELGTVGGSSSDSQVFLAGPDAGSVYVLPRYRRVARD